MTSVAKGNDLLPIIRVGNKIIRRIYSDRLDALNRRQRYILFDDSGYNSILDRKSNVAVLPAENAEGITEHNSDLLLASDDHVSGQRLWKVHPYDPEYTGGSFGLLGRFPYFPTTPTQHSSTLSLNQANGMTSHNGQLLVINDSGDNLWNINPARPSDTSGSFGKLGDFPTSLGNPVGIASHNNEVYIIERAHENDRAELWKLSNTATPSAAGKVGNFPFMRTSHGNLVGGRDFQGLVSHDGKLLACSNELSNSNPKGEFNPLGLPNRGSSVLWNINPANPSDTSGDFGVIGVIYDGRFTVHFSDLASYFGDLYGCSNRVLYRVNPDNPKELTARIRRPRI